VTDDKPISFPEKSNKNMSEKIMSHCIFLKSQKLNPPNINI